MAVAGSKGTMALQAGWLSEELMRPDGTATKTGDKNLSFAR